MSALEYPTLDSVSAEFAKWRSHRTSFRTPESLQRQAVDLLKHYRMGEVLKALRLSHKSLKRWSQRWSGHSSVNPSEPSNERFIALPPISQVVGKDEELADRVSLKLSCQDIKGRTLSIEASLDDAQWRWALELLSAQDQT